MSKYNYLYHTVNRQRSFMSSRSSMSSTKVIYMSSFNEVARLMRNILSDTYASRYYYVNIVRCWCDYRVPSSAGEAITHLIRSKHRAQET